MSGAGNSRAVAAPPPGDDLIGPYAGGLVWDPAGVWVATAHGDVSYPDEGNAACAAIEDTSFWFRHRNRVIAAAVRRFPPLAGPIFDIGGGNGYVSLGLQRAGYSTVLV